MMKIIFAFTVLVSFAAIDASEVQECFKKGKCKDSYQIVGKGIENQYLCRKECQMNSFCKWFTFFKDTTYCQLYRDCVILDDQSCSDCLSGEKDCSPPEIKCGLTGKCRGEAFSTKSAQTTDECLKLCQAEASCNWFTFYGKQQSCHLFTSCNNLDGCDACVSGNSKCSAESRGNKWYNLV